MASCKLWCAASVLLMLACQPKSALDGTADGATDDTDDGGSETTTESGDSGVVCPVSECEDPIEFEPGYERCADGSINRVASVPIDLEALIEPCHGTEAGLLCQSDADCDDFPGVGKCGHSLSPNDRCECYYMCEQDSDCAADEACIPRSVLGTSIWPFPVCRRALCHSREECGECGECGAGYFFQGCETLSGLVCRSDGDECRVNDDCEDECFPLDDQTWTCEESMFCPED
jgi:hypothetical protein